MVVGAMGVVFGDIGTSPLYTLKVCFGIAGVPPDLPAVLGICSLLLWALIVVVCIKYIGFVMRVDHDGEGGILALLALARPPAPFGTVVSATGLTLVVIVGASMLLGDGIITPAISVISAVEGLSVASKAAESYVVPISLAIIVALFAFQRGGTERVGRLFGPVMVIWFVVIAWLGLVALVRRPEVLLAIDPRHALAFATRHGVVGFTILGGVILAVTGVEALYADLSHFGRTPIVTGWFALVFPALSLNYLGQGAMLLADPRTLENPFYALAPEWALIPMVVLATIATVIASQALISGTFTLIEQAVALNLARACSSATRRRSTRARCSCRSRTAARSGLRDPLRCVPFERPPRRRLRLGGRGHDAVHVARVLQRDHPRSGGSASSRFRSWPRSASSTAVGRRFAAEVRPRRLRAVRDQRGIGEPERDLVHGRARLGRALADQQTPWKRSSNACRPAWPSRGRWCS